MILIIAAFRADHAAETQRNENAEGELLALRWNHGQWNNERRGARSAQG